MTKPSTTIIGAAGEHYVASYLSAISNYQLIIAMPRGGVPGLDLLVTKEYGGHAIRIQVKTGTLPVGKYDGQKILLWPTGWAAIERRDDYLWYAYLNLNGWPGSGKSPDIYFVPSKKVSDIIAECREDKDTRPYFWIYEDESDRYRGDAGYRSLLAVLDGNEG